MMALGRKRSGSLWNGGGWARLCGKAARGAPIRLLGKMGGSESSCGGGTHVVGKVMGGGSEKREDALGLMLILVRKRSRSSVE